MGERKESLVSELIGAALLCGAGLLLLLPLLWAFDATGLAWQAAVGYGALYLVALLSALGTALLLRLLGLHPEGRGYGPRLLTGIAVSAFLMAAFAALTALRVTEVAAGLPGWAAALFYLGGLLASYGAFVMNSAVYTGQSYRLAALAVSVLAYLVFAAWPAAARALFGWLARLLGLAP